MKNIKHNSQSPIPKKREPKSVNCKYCSVSFYTGSLNPNVWVCYQCKKEKQLKYSKIFYKEYWKKNRHTLKESQKPKNRKYYSQNKEKIKDKSSKYYQQNRLKCIKRNTKRKLKRYDVDYVFKMAQIFRARLNVTLRKIKIQKEVRSKDLVGCDWNTLKNYIESKFQPGMTWDNHGTYGWHVDHIIPCSLFNLTKIEDQKKCFHYTNLQPLWAKENLVKYNNIDLYII